MAKMVNCETDTAGKGVEMSADHLSLSSLAPGLQRMAPGTLYPHQLEGVTFLLSQKRAILTDDMGLGKSRQGTPWSATWA